MSANHMSFSEAEQQQVQRIRTHVTDVPSRFDLNTGDTTASELLDDIITNCCPKSWYYFLEHILTSKTSHTLSNSSPNHTNHHQYSFQIFNKFFVIFKSSNKANHGKYIKDNNIFYTKIWLLHAQSHIMDYQNTHKHSKSRSLKKEKLRNISFLYKQLFTHQIGTICSEFYIEWAKYYILCKKYEKAKKKIKIGIKAKAHSIEELNTFYMKLNNIYTNKEDECASYSDLSTSSDSTYAATNSDSENDDHTATRYLGTPRRVFNTQDKPNQNDDEEDEEHFDDEEEEDEEDDDEFLKNYSYQYQVNKRLSAITENDLVSPIKTLKSIKSIQRTPFAPINNVNNTSNTMSMRLGNNPRPFTPNTLLRNMANNKSFSFSNRSSAQSKECKSNDIKPYNNKTSPLYRNNNRIQFDMKSNKASSIENRSRRISEPISPSWNSNKVSISPPEQPLAAPIQPCLKKRKTSTQIERENVNIKKKNEEHNVERNKRRNNENKYRNNNKYRHQMNLMTVNDRKMMQLKCIGRGGSSKVFKVITKDTFEILALKKITVSNSVDVDPGGEPRDPMENFLNEIDLLNKLKKKKHCIQMIDYEILDDLQNNSKEIRMLFECGEIDLAHLLKKEQSGHFDDINQIAFYWKQMLVAVATVHGFRIVHGDLKPANFLLVQGELKIIDFGIAKQIVSNDTTRIARDSQIGTLNYICPEALISSNNKSNCYKLGRSADVWSLGCILHQMAFGFTPFTHLKFAAKLQCIVGPTAKINIKTHRNQNINDIMKQCLIREPQKRISIKELLEYPIAV